jgi:hypothetical protein
VPSVVCLFFISIFKKPILSNFGKLLTTHYIINGDNSSPVSSKRHSPGARKYLSRCATRVVILDIIEG